MPKKCPKSVLGRLNGHSDRASTVKSYCEPHFMVGSAITRQSIPVPRRFRCRNCRQVSENLPTSSEDVPQPYRRVHRGKLFRFTYFMIGSAIFRRNIPVPTRLCHRKVHKFQYLQSIGRKGIFRRMFADRIINISSGYKYTATHPLIWFRTDFRVSEAIFNTFRQFRQRNRVGTGIFGWVIANPTIKESSA